MKKISCVLGLLLWAGGVWGYQFQVSPVVLQGPLTEDQHRLDMNGTECGVLLVTTPIENIDFKMSAIGGCGVEKTAAGYAVFLGQNTRYVTLSAPNFKPLRWEFNLPAGGMQEKAYTAELQSAGENPASFSFSTHILTASFKAEMFGLAARFAGKGQAVLKIYTDLPFSVLQENLLIPGSYTVQPPQDAAPYYLYIKGRTALGKVIQKESLSNALDWAAPLEAKTDYVLDLTWQPNPSQLAKQAKAQLKDLIK